MRRKFTRVIMILQETDLIKIISSYARVWPDWVYMIHCCQANWWVYQASASTGNKQHYLPLTKPLVVSLISLLFVKSKTISRLPNFSISVLHKPSKSNSRKPETEQQRPISHLLSQRNDDRPCAYTTFVCVHICMASTRNKFVVTPCLCNNRFIRTKPEGHRPKGSVCINLLLHSQGCNNIYLYLHKFLKYLRLLKYSWMYLNPTLQTGQFIFSK